MLLNEVLSKLINYKEIYYKDILVSGYINSKRPCVIEFYKIKHYTVLNTLQ